MGEERNEGNTCQKIRLSSQGKAQCLWLEEFQGGWSVITWLNNTENRRDSSYLGTEWIAGFNPPKEMPFNHQPTRYCSPSWTEELRIVMNYSFQTAKHLYIYHSSGKTAFCNGRSST